MLSKGHDYGNLTLSIITGLDHILGMADYRAREKAMSLCVQIAGRSGRKKSAKVIVQSSNGQFFKRYMQDYEAFIKEELEVLKKAQYPPFFTLARVLISHKDDTKAAALMKKSLDEVQNAILAVEDEISILGYGRAPIERVSNRWRYHITLRSKKRTTMLRVLHHIKNQSITIDMDPINFS